MWSKRVVFSLFILISTFIAICLNWSKFFMGHSATIFNFIVSTVFILLWLIYSFFWGIKQEKLYKKFILIYWGLNFVSSMLIWIISFTRSSAIFLFAFAIWYGSPVYGFTYLITDYSSFILITAPLGLIINLVGYLIGLLCSKKNKT